MEPGVVGPQVSAPDQQQPVLGFGRGLFGREPLERALIERALAQTEGNRTQAARLLDISYKALVYKIRGYGLED